MQETETTMGARRSSRPMWPLAAVGLVALLVASGCARPPVPPNGHPGAHFSTLAPNAVLPSGATCAVSGAALDR